MRRAKFFHERMINGDIEKPNSPFRNVVVKECDDKVTYSHFLGNQNSYKSIDEINIEDLPISTTDHSSTQRGNYDEKDKNKYNSKSSKALMNRTSGARFPQIASDGMMKKSSGSGYGKTSRAKTEMSQPLISFGGTESSRLFINHLSPNRNFQLYQESKF